MTTLKFSGNGADKSFLPDVKGLIVMLKGTTITPPLAKTLTGWKTLIAPATTAVIKATFISLERGFDSKTTAPEFTTANTGLKEKTKDFPPEFTGHALMSWDDYRTWFAADGQVYSFIPMLDNGNLITPFDNAGNVTGFDGRMFLTFDLPKAGGAEKQKQTPFDIMFNDVEQMKAFQIIKTGFRRRDIEGLVPVGVNIEVLTPYEVTGGTVVVKATNRVSGEPYIGFPLITQWKVASASADLGGSVTVISAVNAALGLYTLTVLNVAAKMTGPFEIQAETIIATQVSYLSNVLTIPV